MSEIRQPRAFRLDPAASETSAVVITDSADDPFDVDRVDEAAEPRRGWRFGLWSLFATALGLFVSLAIGVWGFAFVERLIATYPVLGWIAAGLGAIALLALLLLALREWLILRRLASVEALRTLAAKAHAADDRDSARAVIAGLLSLMPNAPSDVRSELSEHARAIIDGRDLLQIGERMLLGPADRAAADTIGAAARRVSIVTAISPRAWVDILFVLAQSVRLIRGVAVIYGGRPSGFGSLRLFRKVLSHLALTGGVAMTDSILSQVVGAGLAARLSAKLGEGVLNGVLTARVGLAAIEVCRPMPFLAAEPPKLSEIASSLLKRSDA